MGVDAAIDITTEERQTVLGLLQRHLPGTAAWVYGSRVKWTSRPQSDLDLVVFATPEQRPHVGDLREAFEESNLSFRVDLFVWDDVPESFRARITANHVVMAKAHAAKRREWRGEGENWDECALGELTDNFDSIRVPVKRADRSPGPYPYYGASEVVDHVADYLFDGEYLLVAEDGENLRTRNTPIAFLANGKFWANNHAHVIRANRKADTRFLMYALSQLNISGYVTGSTMPKLTQDNMNRIRVWIPAVREQRAIAHILGTLDDKIELNRRMNATLEAMARALFRSWFVDFDPVRAKMEGRDTGLPKDIADLFPDRLVDSELGAIPESWESARLDNVANITKGRSYRSRELVASDTALVTLKSFARGGGYRPEGLKPFRGVYKNEQVVQPGEVIVACTDVTQAAEVVGRSAVVGATSSFRTLVASLDVSIVRPKNAGVGRAFVYYLTGTEDFVAHALARTTGTTVLHLSKDAVASFRFALPPRPLVERFEHCANSLRAGIHANASAVASLADLRDALLPNLVSGDLRVNGLELASGRNDRPASVGMHEA